jgi:uncharacterized protein YbjT (DUF2867 family)
MSEARPLRVVIAGGTGFLGQQLARILSATCEVRALTAEPHVNEGDEPGKPGLRRWSCDLLSIPDTEVALAGADVVVFLARVSRPPARLVQAVPADLERLMADSVARAAPRTSVKKLVFFACEAADPREPVLRSSGLPVAVLRGGGPDPAQALAALTVADAATEQLLPAWSPPARSKQPARPGVLVCSVQRFDLPRGWSAKDVADGYFEWLSSGLPLVRAEKLERNVIVRTAGIPVLMLRHAEGASESESCALDVHDGALVRRGVPATLEFRALPKEQAVYAILHGFSPALPWPVYRVTQALAHTSSMKRFGRWLAAQTPRSEAA